MKYNGILEDNRPQKLKDKDYDSRELDLGETKWLTKKTAQKNADKYISRNQYSKSSCVPSSMCNALWNTEGVELADEYLYTQRANKPQEGCWWNDIADIVVNQGVCQRKDLKEVKTEAEANKVMITSDLKHKARPYRQLSYINITKPTVDELASWSNRGYAVPFSKFSISKEWGLEYPEIINKSLTLNNATIHHAVCVIPNTGYMDKGKKYVIITDSAHFGKRHIRHLSEEFLAARAKHGVVFTDLPKGEHNNVLTDFKFTRDLTVGDTGNDVFMLQTILRELGFFPNLTPTGFFGGITRQAVKDFQQFYEDDILTIIGLKSPTGYFGKSSRNKLHKITAKSQS